MRRKVTYIMFLFLGTGIIFLYASIKMFIEGNIDSSEILYPIISTILILSSVVIRKKLISDYFTNLTKSKILFFIYAGFILMVFNHFSFFYVPTELFTIKQNIISCFGAAIFIFSLVLFLKENSSNNKIILEKN